VEGLHIHWWLLGLSTIEHISGALQQLGLPLSNMIGVDIEALRMLGDCLFTFDSGQGHLGFELG
jgi:hypothetical protein